MPHAGEVGAKGGAAEIAERCLQGPIRRRDHRRFKQGQHTLAIGLPQGNEPRAGGYPVRRQRVKEGMHRRRERNRMRGADQADRDGINNCSVAMRNHLVEPVAIPCRARDIDKRAALRRRLELAFARGYEGSLKFGDVPQSRIVP